MDKFYTFFMPFRVELAMRFEFDAAKSQANKAKHGIDFEEAQALWNGGGWFELPLISEGEPRALIVGVIGDKHWAAIITYRADPDTDHFRPTCP